MRRYRILHRTCYSFYADVCLESHTLRLLETSRGYLHADAYSGYDAIFAGGCAHRSVRISNAGQ